VTKVSKSSQWTNKTNTSKKYKPKLKTYDQIDEKAEFLIVDARESEDYANFHIKDAINYPLAFFNRDKYIPKLY